ncbi:short-subunit dehydrogenase [Salirhabdus euzebyi]|uniref:Short-subunit dehydrogenase n=1 Tax=Salirhabdus euzebyi TaxID=394506 RepID=A0A841PV30_9BACI|nr:short-subunit dehydrogenase [Salirhabdus euzebyi]
MRKTAIVTGASSGFGLLTTIELAKTGFHVIATVRNLEKAAIIEDHISDRNIMSRIEPFLLDVTDDGSIAKLSEKVEELNRIDVLVNNAGFAMGGFCEDVRIESYRKQFETNVFGVMAVTQTVLSKMRAQGEGTIINVSSISGIIAFPGLSPYVSSKFALEGYTESLRLEVKPYGIQVALVEPGSFQTNIWSSGMEVEEKSLSDNSPYYDYMKGITTALEKGKKNHGNPQKVAILIRNLALQQELKKLRYPIGQGVKMSLRLKKILSWKKWENMFFKQLFNRTK